MGQVALKTGMRPGMALGAGSYNISLAESRSRIVHRKHIVCAMTVVALGRVSLPQLGRFSVIGVQVRLGNVFVTVAALVHYSEIEICCVGAGDFMGRVAVAAARQVGLSREALVFSVIGT